MGVHGLWKLIEPSSQMVPLESLAGKILAIDVSIWLHQAVKGMHDASGAPVAVAHLIILFHRLCKLLFYKIKPVFVFDGGVPTLKRQTMAARRQQSSAAKNEAVKVREKLIKNLLKHEAVRQVLSSETATAALGLNCFTLPGPSTEEDLYKLPPIAADYVDSESSESISSNEEDDKHVQDIHSIDVSSKEFLGLPAEVRHDILTELIDTRKQSSWKYLDSMPKKSDSFSDFQMDRLLKRRAVQTSLEKAGKEMGGRSLSLRELESLLGDQGVLDSKTDVPGKRIAQDSVTRYMLIQKSSPEVLPEEKKTKIKTEKFDIMNHLEEVDWSSESDTDVILKKTSDEKSCEKLHTKVELTESVGKDINEIKKPNAKPRSISKFPKIRMTEEIASLLSVLEDDVVPNDVKEKVEDLRNQIEPQKKLNTETMKSDVETEKEILVSAEVLTDFPLIKKESENTPQTIIFPDKETTVSPEAVNDFLSIQKESENTPQTIIVSEKKTTVSPEVVTDFPPIQKESGNTSQTIIVPEKETVIKSYEENEMTKTQVDSDGGQSVTVNSKTIDSSSDSENDFIPIASEDSQCVLLPESIKSPKNIVSAKNGLGEPITITITPSEPNQKDDLFSDVFHSGEFEEKNLGKDKQDIEIDKLENDRQSVEMYKAEFEKHIGEGNIRDLKKTLEDQQLDLMKEKGKQERHALNPTDQMYSDAQELLRLFGIPFVVAPMEAEAQCAALNIYGLTEGTITDDSDIWLFGGQLVYKNFFNQNKHVLEYRAADIQKYFKLSREDMIKMALLVGSDYTVGLNGIGPVTALEILAAFRSPGQSLLDSLSKFRDWFTGKSLIGPSRAALKKKIKNTIISPGFPNKAVVEAYLNPQVDDSKEPFSWAKPNLDLIHKYTKSKMGWSQEKCDELLLPVLKKLEENTNQFTMEKYFRIEQKSCIPDGALSKRVESAIKRLGNDWTETEDLEKTENVLKPLKKRKQSRADNCNEPGNTERPKGNSKTKRKRKDQAIEEKSGECSKPQIDVNETLKKPVLDPASRTKLINQKLHQNVKVPQKEMTQKLLEDRKKQAIEIFRTFKKGGKKKNKVYAKQEVKLSESSSDED